MEKVKNFVVVGGLWWDKPNGNTYCKAHILDPETNEHYYSSVSYGSGQQFIHVAREYIKDHLGYCEEDINIIDMGTFYIKHKDLRNNNF